MLKYPRGRKFLILQKITLHGKFAFNMSVYALIEMIYKNRLHINNLQR